MVKDYWVYQQRQCTDPWALYIVKEYDPRHPECTSLDFTVYGEFIDNPTHSVSEVNIKYDRILDYVSHIGKVVRAFGGIFEDEENVQMDKAILRILTDRRKY